MEIRSMNNLIWGPNIRKQELRWVLRWNHVKCTLGIRVWLIPIHYFRCWGLILLQMYSLGYVGGRGDWSFTLFLGWEHGLPVWPLTILQHELTFGVKLQPRFISLIFYSFITISTEKNKKTWWRVSDINTLHRNTLLDQRQYNKFTTSELLKGYGQ